MARENPRWGFMRIKGECRKVGVSVAATTVKKVLRAAGLEPAPRRDGPSWSEFLGSQAEAVWACDFFTVETALLRTLYVLFFIEVGSRRLHVTTSTCNPSGEFVAQQARNLVMDGALEGVAFLIRDRDSKYTGAFDEVFTSEGARVIKAPVRAPKANAFAERLARTVRHEVLDLTLVLGRGTWTESFGATPSTTTPTAPTEARIFELQPEPPSGRSQPRCQVFAGSMSSVA
jgi:putative transposase